MGEDIFKSLCFQGVITGTTVVLMDVGQFQGPIVYKSLKEKTGIRSTHEIQFSERTSEIIKSSGI